MQGKLRIDVFNVTAAFSCEFAGHFFKNLLEKNQKISNNFEPVWFSLFLTGSIGYGLVQSALSWFNWLRTGSIGYGPVLGQIYIKATQNHEISMDFSHVVFKLINYS